MEVMDPDHESRDSPTLITTIEDCPRTKTRSPSPVKIKTEPTGTSTSMPIARRKITISAEEFERLKARNVLSVKSVKSDVQDLDVSNEGISIPFEAKDTFLIKVEPNCPIKMVNIDGVLQIEAVKDCAGKSTKRKTRSASKASAASVIKKKTHPFAKRNTSASATSCVSASVSGASVSGASVCGASVSGASVSGASVSGIKRKNLFPIRASSTSAVSAQRRRSALNVLKAAKKTSADTLTRDLTYEKVTSHVKVAFPSLQVRKLTSGNSHCEETLEITRRQADVYGNEGPKTGACVLFFTKSMKAEMRVLDVEEPFISKSVHEKVGIIGRIDFGEFDNVLSYLRLKYSYCGGIPIDEFDDECPLAVLKHLPGHVVKGTLEYRSVACARWFDKTTSGGVVQRGDRCPACCEAFKIASNPSDITMETSCNSLDLLSIEELQNQVRSLAAKTRKLLHFKRRKKKEEKRLAKEAAEAVNCFGCSLCREMFADKSALATHKSSEHKRNHKCDICDKSFYTKSMLKGHEKIHSSERPYKCSICDKGFFGQYALKQHARVHSNEKTIKCEECDEWFRTASAMKAHVKRRHLELQHMCEYCAKSFADASHLRMHIMIHTGEKPYECRHCGWRYAQKGGLKKHELTHIKGRHKGSAFECAICEEAFENSDLLNEHQAVHSVKPWERPYQCEHCPLKFPNSRRLIIHEATHNEEKNFKCDFPDCGKMFREKAAMKKHMNVHLKKLPFHCQYCPKMFAFPAYVKIHERIHTGEKPYKCGVENCQKSFAQKSGLTTHQLSVHAEETPFKCDHCGKMFSSPSSLRDHVRTHTGEKPFKCRHCDVCFTNLGQRHSHELRHTGTKRFACDHCEKRFILKSDLVKHVRTHTGEKPFKCKYCDAKFAQQSSAKSHERQHANRSPFECNKCSKTFQQKSTLKQHLLTIHKS